MGIYEMDKFGEAKRSAGGYITLDFLRETTSGGQPSPAFAKTIALYPGLRSSREFVGIPARRPRVVDRLGRVRPKSGRSKP
jgi:hypothetical protein